MLVTSVTVLASTLPGIILPLTVTSKLFNLRVSPAVNVGSNVKPVLVPYSVPLLWNFQTAPTPYAVPLL